jgi:cytochrome c oxidase subunit 2
VQKGWSILFGVVILAATLLFVISPFVHGWWMPHAASSWAKDVDGLFYLILGITGFFFLLTEGILVYNMYRSAHIPGRKSDYVHGHHKLEVFWTSVTAVILLIITFAQVGTWGIIKYWWGFPMFAKKNDEGTVGQVMNHFTGGDDGPMQMEVSARQFEWRLRYPSLNRMKSFEASLSSPDYEVPANFVSSPHIDDVHVVNEVHVWKGAKVLVHLKTHDVIHSFYLPNLRLKQDALPGKTIPVWFEAIDFNTAPVDKDGKRIPLDNEGKPQSPPAKWVDGYDADHDQLNESTRVWELACAELCGWGHYKMQGRLYVHQKRGDFEAWLQDAAKKGSAHQP